MLAKGTHREYQGAETLGRGYRLGGGLGGANLQGNTGQGEWCSSIVDTECQK